MPYCGPGALHRFFLMRGLACEPGPGWVGSDQRVSRELVWGMRAGCAVSGLMARPLKAGHGVPPRVFVLGYPHLDRCF